MTLRTLRAQARSLLDAVPTARPAALRRSDAADALLATDLPRIAGAEDTAVFCRQMTALGWTVRPQGGWLLLDAPLFTGPAGAFPADVPGETGCALSLLRRHPGPAGDKAAARAVVKAAEQGPDALEKLCAGLHGEWAQALRQGRPLPGALLPILIEAAKEAHLI